MQKSMTLVMCLFIVGIQKNAKPSKGMWELIAYLVRGVPRKALVLPKGLTTFKGTRNPKGCVKQANLIKGGQD